MPASRRLSLLTAALAAAAACGSAHAAEGSFVRDVTNPWFPLEPGTVFTYTGEKDGGHGRDVVTVTHATKVIRGVRCTAVSDRLYVRGHLAERTTDWYAQDTRGNVWYFGEDTAELDRAGKVTSREGTWQAGVHGAQAGIFMPAQPRVGRSFRQEYLKGHADDHFAVIKLAGRSLVTKEWTPLEPGTLDHKVYRRGTGLVKEETVRGGNERWTLADVRHR
ncbi:MAG TPA: hypothetical protein VIR59_02030 [Gaiellaceae bacterium]